MIEINSSLYRFNIVNDVFNFINKEPIIFFNIDSKLYNYYNNFNMYYNYLEKNIIKEIKNGNVYGYNKLNIDALFKIKSNKYIIHDEIYNDLTFLYQNFFSNLSVFEMLYPLFNNFNFEYILNPSNYIKVLFDKEFDYKMFFYIKVLELMLFKISDQINTSINFNVYDDLIEYNIKNDLYINFFNNDKLNKYIEEIILDNKKLKISLKFNIIDLYNNFVDKNVNNIDTLKIFFSIEKDFVYDFLYNIYNLDFIYYDKLDDVSNFVEEFILNEFLSIKNNNVYEINSLITLSNNFKEDHLQFINSILYTISIICDNYIINKQNKMVLDNIYPIINGIKFNYENFEKYIKNNYLNLFKESKSIDLIILNFISNLVNKFIFSNEFNDYFLKQYIYSLKDYLYVYNIKYKIDNNIDSIKLYIKFLLIEEIFSKNNLKNLYTYLLNNIELNIKDLFKVVRYKNLNLDYLKLEFNKFIYSLVFLKILDRYIDNFRLIKKYQKNQRLN